MAKRVTEARRTRTYSVHMTETRHYVLEVNAGGVSEAKEAAWKLWRDAPEVGGYEIPDTETDIVSVLEALCDRHDESPTP